MIIGAMVILLILGIMFFFIADSSFQHEELFAGIGVILIILTFGVFIFGCLHGFVNYPPTEGTHQGVITAVDLEGNWFRRYEVYLKSSGYTEQSDETVYKVYVDETELIEELKNAIGKEVRLHYGHDGGYIAWNSCGTYHIKDVEIVEEEE